MDIKQIRMEIDEIDEQLSALFARRMRAASEVAKWKKETGMAVLDASREREVLFKAAERVGEPLSRYAVALYKSILEISRGYQRTILSAPSPLREAIERARLATPESFPTSATVACQGVEGAYSAQACDRMIGSANILFFSSFDGVFSAVEKGLCRYGVLPIENSTAGSVAQVYDLMEKHRFYIARGLRLHVDHALLVNPGARLEDIREVFSHPQAIAQCGEFLKSNPKMRAIPVENTAVAAMRVAESKRQDSAAIASGRCASLYGLASICDSVNDTANNYTRFICISREMEIYQGSNKISMTLSLPHQPGALNSLIARFGALNVNLTKLESRPVPGRDFEFRFHFDIEASVASEEIVSLLTEIEATCERFVFLGNYLETY